MVIGPPTPCARRPGHHPSNRGFPALHPQRVASHNRRAVCRIQNIAESALGTGRGGPESPHATVIAAPFECRRLCDARQCRPVLPRRRETPPLSPPPSPMGEPHRERRQTAAATRHPAPPTRAIRTTHFPNALVRRPRRAVFHATAPGHRKVFPVPVEPRRRSHEHHGCDIRPPRERIDRTLQDTQPPHIREQFVANAAPSRQSGSRFRRPAGSPQTVHSFPSREYPRPPAHISNNSALFALVLFSTFTLAPTLPP